MKKGLFLVLILWVSVGCIKSSDPAVTELLSVNAPSFSGLNQVTFTTTLSTYTLIGQCDANSLAIQESCAGQSFTNLSVGCIEGQFSSVIQLSSLQTVCLYRTVLINGYTSTAQATIFKTSGAQFLQGGFVQSATLPSQNHIGSSSLTLSQEKISSAGHELHPGFIEMIFGSL